MKHRGPLLLLAIASILILGCVGAASPRGWAAPVETGDLVLVSASRGKLDAIDRRTGERRWRFPDDWEIADKEARRLQGIYAQPILAGDRLYLADYGGYVYLVDMSSQPRAGSKGRVLWSLRPGGPIVGGMALDRENGTLFVTSDDGNVYALRTGDDRARFHLFHKTGDRIWAAPVLAEGKLFVASTDGRLYALDPRTGDLAWPPYSGGGALVSTPTVSGRAVLVGGFDSKLHAIGAAGGEELWVFAAGDWVWARPLVETGTVYIADFKGDVYALRLSDGGAVWSRPFSAGSPVRAAPVMLDGAVVVVTEKGSVYAIEAASGERRWGPVEVGTGVLADLAAGVADPQTVYIASKGCITLDQSAAKTYYYGLSLEGARPVLRSTTAVC